MYKKNTQEIQKKYSLFFFEILHFYLLQKYCLFFDFSLAEVLFSEL
jgi:hypothetical protein